MVADGAALLAAVSAAVSLPLGMASAIRRAAGLRVVRAFGGCFCCTN